MHVRVDTCAILAMPGVRCYLPALAATRIYVYVDIYIDNRMCIHVRQGRLWSSFFARCFFLEVIAFLELRQSTAAAAAFYYIMGIHV